MAEAEVDPSATTKELSPVSKHMTADRLLQTIGGVLLLIIGYISTNALAAVQTHENRLIKVETRLESQQDILREIKDDLKEIKAKLGATHAKP